MPHFVIKTLPFKTRITHGARNILAADQARARKLMAGLHPHGPVTVESRHQLQHNLRRHMPLRPTGDSDTTTDPQISAAVSDASIDATDAGTHY